MSTLKHTLAYNAETEQIVKPTGMRKAFANAVEYDPVRDKGKLVCIHCKQARMTHRDEKLSIGAGNVFGWQSHFMTVGSREPKKEKTDKEGNVIPYAPNVHKEDCVASVVASDHESEFDATKGYKIYIDMGNISRVFRGNAALISRDPETRRIVNHDPDLVDRERLTMKTPRDFIAALKHLDADRLKRSVVVYQNHKYTWDELFLRAEPRTAKQPEIRWLNAAKNILSGKDLPAFAHINLTGKASNIISDPREGKRMRYLLGTVVANAPSERREITVKFWLNVRSEHMFDMVRQSPLQEFIGLVKPEGYYDRKDRGVFHVDLTFRNPKFLAEADLRAITLEAKRNAQARQEAPVPSAAP